MIESTTDTAERNVDGPIGAAIAEIITELEGDVVAVALCGSYARGEAHALSDVDIQIALRSPRQQRRIEWRDGLRFDIFLRYEKALREAVLQDLVLAGMLSDCVPLYDPEAVLIELRDLAKHALTNHWRRRGDIALEQLRFAFAEALREIEELSRGDLSSALYGFHTIIRETVALLFDLRHTDRGKATAALRNLSKLDRRAYELVAQALDETREFSQRLACVQELHKRLFSELGEHQKIRPPSWHSPWVALLRDSSENAQQTAHANGKSASP